MEHIDVIIRAILAFVSLLFIISIIIERNDIADVAWGPGIAIVAWVAMLTNTKSLELPHLVFLALISLWAVRLGLRIGLKNAHRPEDVRYQRWRESWGAWFYPRSFVQVYLLQGALMVVLGASAIFASQFSGREFNELFVILGATVWLVGFLFEVIGDFQLDQFLGDPSNRGRLMTSGLWRYSRHPNYFGEITMWWGLWLIVAPLPASWLALVSPIAITLLICFVSGIPMLEPLMAKHPDWGAYKKRTSVLIPWPPRRSE